MKNEKRALEREGQILPTFRVTKITKIVACSHTDGFITQAPTENTDTHQRSAAAK